MCSHRPEEDLSFLAVHGLGVIRDTGATEEGVLRALSPTTGGYGYFQALACRGVDCADAILLWLFVEEQTARTVPRL